MRFYCVGGAVRDRLLGLQVRERDWVVVGGTEEAMRARGFRKVEAWFPVFLHPETGEEYALARTERKSGSGYHGFTWCADPDITLEQDLQRRDLRINAMAEDADGAVIDPWGGRADLEARRLRHVSEAYSEDPLRVLRTARFAARFAGLGFAVAPETLDLMRRLCRSGELDALPDERLWLETQKVLGGDAIAAYFAVLRDCGALEVLGGAPEPAHWGEAGALDDPDLRAAALLVRAPKSRLWARCPRDLRDLGETAAALLDLLPLAHGDAAGRVDFLLRADCRRRPERFARLLQLLRHLAGEDASLWRDRAHRMQAAETAFLAGRDAAPADIRSALDRVRERAVADE